VRNCSLAIVGATGAVGRELVSALSTSNLPIKKLKLLGSDDSIGKTLEFSSKEIYVDSLDRLAFKDVDIAVFVAGIDVSRQFAEEATESGAVVIDCSGLFVFEPDVPTVVPGVNSDDIELYKNRGIIASPHPVSIMLSSPLSVLEREFGIERVVVSTYQAVSGMGMKAVEELMNQTRSWFEFDYAKQTAGRLPRRIAFNCIPEAGVIDKQGFCAEEKRIAGEVKRILGDDGLRIVVNSVYVPVFSSHGAYVIAELSEQFKPDAVVKTLKKARWCQLERDYRSYKTPVDMVGKDYISIGRLKILNDEYPDALSMWIVADNLSGGSSINILRIVDLLVKEYL